MTEHRVSARPAGATLIAVVGLIVGAAAVAAGHESSKSKMPPIERRFDGAGQTCHAWVASTRHANHKVGENGTRDVTIKALAQACSAVPEQLRRAAGEVQEMKDPIERAAMLGTAASAALGEGCAVADPLVNALMVARTCPLPPLSSTFHFQLKEEELVRLGAVDYLLLNVIMRSLIAANEFDEPAKFLILEFTLSAEINRDHYFQKREQRRHRSR
jgi:fumarate hydratase class II